MEERLTFRKLKEEFKRPGIAGLRNQGGLPQERSPERVLISDQCKHTIKVAVFNGTTVDDLRIRREFGGPLFVQLQDATAYLNKYNELMANMGYPATAIREGLINAVLHRDYQFKESTLIKVFDDRIEIISLGGTQGEMTLEEIVAGVSLCRNKVLEDIFDQLNIIKGCGTGITKILESYPKGSQKPKFEIMSNTFKLTLYNMNIEPKSQEVKDSSMSQLTSKEIDILAMFDQKDTITRLDVENSFGVSKAMAARYMKSLLDKGAITRIGTGKIVKYELNKRIEETKS